MQAILVPKVPCKLVSGKGLARSKHLIICRNSNSAYGSWDFDQPGGNSRHPEDAHPNNNYGSWDFDQTLSSPSLVFDNELVGVASELLKHIHATHREMVSHSDPTYAHHVAAAALASAESNGALPPLSAEQRNAFLHALEEVAKHSPLSFDSLSEPEDPAHWFDIMDEGGDEAFLKPEFRSLFEEVANLKMHGGWGHGDNTYNAVASGGSVSNISIPQSRPAPNKEAAQHEVIAPAEGLTERAERAAESDYMRMEVNGFEPHAKAINDITAGGAIGGDAPSAGGGAQIAGSEDEEDNRPPAHDF